MTQHWPPVEEEGSALSGKGANQKPATCVCIQIFFNVYKAAWANPKHAHKAVWANPKHAHKAVWANPKHAHKAVWANPKHAHKAVWANPKHAHKAVFSVVVKLLDLDP